LAGTTDTKVGGRVRSDYTPDGYILDQGYAIFIEEYPTSKQLLDYNSLQLKQFSPGAGVKLSGREELALPNSPSYLKVASSSLNKTNVDNTFSYSNIENTSVLSPSPNTSQTGAVQDPPQHAMKQNAKSATKGKILLVITIYLSTAF
jgi:hypothetical protein